MSTRSERRKDRPNRYYDKVHLRVFGGCASFVSACTCSWCYDSGLWEADRTDREAYVTCPACRKRIAEWKRVNKWERSNG